MSKLSFRARAPDPSKPMPVFFTDELPDLPDFTSSNRAVPQMPTGMEKEEESEHHLQRAISAQQVYGTANHLVIPTPEATQCIENYEALYEASVRQGKQYIHMQPLTMEQDIPDYDMDAEDENWVRKQAKAFDLTPLKFEIMMDRLEKGSGQKVLSVKEAKALLKEDDDLTLAVYDYWLNKRLKVGHSLILEVKGEKRDGSTTNNPYVAFRRRTEKMQTRKNRKNDETSYEKMLKLKRDLSKAVTLLEMIKRREKSKREGIHLTIEIFEKRFQMEDYSGQVLNECEELVKKQPSFVPFVNGTQYWSGKEESIRKKREYKKRKHKLPSASISEKPRQSSTAPARVDSHVHTIRTPETEFLTVQSPPDVEEEDPDGAFAFRRKKGCQYHAPQPEVVCSWPWSSDEHTKSMQDLRYRYCCTSLRVPRRCVGFARRRVGRGGRLLLDRAFTTFNDDFRDFEDQLLHTYSPSDNSPLPHRTDSDQDLLHKAQNVQNKLSLPLNHILEEIKAGRTPHYRPKSPPPGQESYQLPLLPPADPIYLEDPFNYASDENMDLSQPVMPPSDSTFHIQGPQSIIQRIDNSQELQDSQLIEVDVVGHDTPHVTSSLLLKSHNSNSLEGIKSMTDAQIVDNRTSNDISRNGKVMSNHIGLQAGHIKEEFPSRVPEGHSTAPADTVLELNYPLPSARTNLITDRIIIREGLTSLRQNTDSKQVELDKAQDKNNQNLSKDAVSILMTSPSVAQKNCQNVPVELKGSGLVHMDVETVRKITQNNSMQSINSDNHEDTASIGRLGNNQSVPMEVT